MLFEEFPEGLKRKYMIVYNVCLYHFVNIYYIPSSGEFLGYGSARVIFFK